MSATLPPPCPEAPGSGPVKTSDHYDPRGTLTATILGSSLAFVLGSIINVGLPQMQADFDVGATGAQWIVNAYLLPLGALVLLGGALGDHRGRKRVFQAGLLLFAASCLLCAVAWSFPFLLAARALEGVAAAMIAPTSLAIIADAFHGPDRGRAIGTWAGVGAAAGAVAPVVGGVIVDTVGWRWAFVAVTPLALVAWWIARDTVRESLSAPETCAPLDLWGAILVSAGLFALIWGLIALPDLGPSGLVTAALAVGMALLSAFLAVEARLGDRAMTPLRLFQNVSFSGLTAFTLFLYAALGGLMVLLPYVLIQGLGFSATAAGAAILPFPAVLAVLSRLTGGPLADRFGTRPLLVVGASFVALGFFAFAQMPSQNVRYTLHVLPGLLALALGMSLSVAPLTAAVLNSAGERYAGVASGINNAISRIGGLLATALLGIVLLQADLLMAFALAAWAGVALAVMSAVIALATVRPAPAP
ncbi:MFS transporter [Jannaschia pagri]|uniref:MFS transporter n=1 Tax=Jannaschia pagri TaxID=2829797 RepID=A0ABQ4NKQ0_9RHOB|nr:MULTISPECIES: MFS transporter [unclassified Jannaschia]GIT90845.1 MFS transporter [Jannaschia sp. AI_61]GIT94677.1 MFS transporter [Jannaschia sp. AI_62]